MDTGHALYPNLLACWPFYENTGNPQDVKGTNHLTKDASVTWSTDSAGDVALAFSSSTVHQALALASQISAFDGTVNFSLAWRMKQTTDNGNGVIAGDADGTTYYIWHRGGNYLFLSPTTTNWPSVQPFTTEADYLLTYEFVVSTSNIVKLYKNGSLTSEGAVSVAIALLIDTLGSGYGGDVSGLIGTMSYFYIWSGRVLSGAEAATLAANPYTIFMAGAGSGPVVHRRAGSQRPGPFLPGSTPRRW